MWTPIRTILVVDDEQDQRERLADLLTDAGYAVLTAPNGARALDTLMHVPGRCLIITDLAMPVMSGWEFVVSLQELPQAALRFPVVVLSRREDVHDAWRLPGVLRTLAKPLRVPELLAVVQEETAPIQLA